jgi:hypothetical protein
MSAKRARKEDSAASPYVADQVAAIEADLRQFHDLDDQKWQANVGAMQALAGNVPRLAAVEQRVEKTINDMNSNIVQIGQRILKERREVDAAHSSLKTELVTACAANIAARFEIGGDVMELQQKVEVLESYDQNSQERITKLEAANKALMERVDMLEKAAAAAALRLAVA